MRDKNGTPLNRIFAFAPLFVTVAAIVMSLPLWANSLEYGPPVPVEGGFSVPGVIRYVKWGRA